ncbi:MAG: hypothetical protein HFI91_14445 [Lachnospiraceae bacterium]|nr:hypothetical protein [Lachnospiraceae bacterium]
MQEKQYGKQNGEYAGNIRTGISAHVTEYILDLTRKYNNLIQMEVSGKTTDFMLDQHVLGQQEESLECK